MQADGSDRNQISGCLGTAGEKVLITKELFEEDVHYVDCGDGFIVYIY